MDKLGRPLLFCHSLVTDGNGMITGYNLRQKEGKKEVIKAMKSLCFETYAFGDSYNDIAMLSEAEHGILFRPPQNVTDDHPEFPVFYDYREMKEFLSQKFV
jgi:phosphoserine/homoserine phosphotransferase